MSTVVIDKGWAWGVTIAGFIANFIIGGLAKSYGILMSDYQELFNCPAAYLTLAGGLIYTFMYTLSLPVHFLGEKFGFRPLIFIGGIGSCVSLIGASYAQHVVLWIVCIGGGLGIFFALVYSPVFVMVGRCFEVHVGVANGISVAGVSVGQIIFPYLVTSLIDKYTVRGATLIGGAVCLNFCLSAVLMPRYVVKSKNSQHRKVKQDTNGDASIPLTNDVAPTDQIPNGDVDSVVVVTAPEVEDPKPAVYLTRLLLGVFIFAKVFGDVGDVGAAIVLPPYGKERGFNGQEISLAIAVAGTVDLVSRLLIGWLSDRPWCKRSVILFVAWLVEGLDCLLVTFQPGLPLFVFCYGIFGVCSGTAMTLMVVVLKDFVGSDALPKSFAFMMLALGFVIGPGQFLVGYIADVTGTYEWSLRSVFLMMILSAGILLFEYPVRYFVRRKHQSVVQSNVTYKRSTEPSGAV